MWTNYHTHSNFCDGKASIADVVTAALEQNVGALGFSSHAPLPFARPWCMKTERFPVYLEEIKIQKAKKGIQIYAGLEIDFIPGKIKVDDFRTDLDYSIGSVHFVDEFEDGTGWEIDGTHQHFLEGYDKIFHNNIRQAIHRYYELTRLMIETSPPDVVGHLDKIKIQNIGGKLFTESDSWYRGCITETLDTIERSGCIVEVNTRGLYQNKSDSTYPSPWILKEIATRNIPITLSSDAHHPSDLVNRFSDTAVNLLSAGFKKIHILLDGAWKPVSFDEHGVQP